MLTFKPKFTLVFDIHQEALQLFSAFCPKGGVICISEVIDISLDNVDSSLCLYSMASPMMYSAYKLNKQGDNMQP